MTSRIAYNNPDQTGALGLPYHYELLSDDRRLKPLIRAIQRVAPGKRVLETGCGSGILSIVAARAGATTVYAVEKDPQIAEFARRNIGAVGGCGGVIRLIEKDIRSVTLVDLEAQPVDVIISEHLSTWLVMEPQMPILNYINRHLATESAIRIPECAFNCLELARSQYRFEDVVELRTQYFGFTGVRAPEILSKLVLFREVDFRKLNSTNIDDTVEVIATRDGIVNGLRLTSPLRILADITFASSDSLMPAVVVPLEHDLAVSEGDVLKVRIQYQCETDWSEFYYCAKAQIG